MNCFLERGWFDIAVHVTSGHLIGRNFLTLLQCDSPLPFVLLSLVYQAAEGAQNRGTRVEFFTL